jgi:glycosyltransferase involved in cell wall biosynthesis
LNLKHVDIIEVPEFAAEAYYLMNLHIPIVFRLHTPSFYDRNTLAWNKFKLTAFHVYFMQIMEYQLLKKAKYITSCSNDLKKWISDIYKNNLPPIKVIYNPVNTTLWANRNVVSPNHHNKDKIQIFFAGTICKEKGVDDLIIACETLINKYNINSELILAGKFARDFKKTSEHEWCKFLGQISQDELVFYYQNVDVVCFPSWWDNMPMVCLEAMFFKALVVGSTSGGMAEIIKDGENGFLAQPKNPAMLSKKILNILSLSDKEKREIKENAYKTVNFCFSTEVIIPQMRAYYQDSHL